MTTWPSSNKAVETTTNEASDTISGAREAISKTIANVNDIIDIFNIPSSPTDNHILKYNASTQKFDVEADSGGGSGIALTDLSVSTNSASGNGSLAYNNSTGVFTFTPADVSAGSATFTDTIQAQGEISIYASDDGQDGTATFAGPNLTLQSTSATFNSGTGTLSGGTHSNLTLQMNKLLLSGFTDKEIQNAQDGDINIRTKEAIDDTATTISLKHDEGRIEVNKPLLLDTQSSDPSGVNGMVYYNTTTHKFRGYANGAWTDLN